MKVDMKFSESNQGFDLSFGENLIVNGGGSGGEDGATFFPHVSPEGVLSWTNDKELPNPEPVNIKGKDGKDGKDGADGKTPVKGTDYYTEADKAEMVSAVIVALPVYNGEVVTE